MGKLSRTLVRSFCPTLGYAITDILTKVTNFIIRLNIKPNSLVLVLAALSIFYTLKFSKDQA